MTGTFVYSDNLLEPGLRGLRASALEGLAGPSGVARPPMGGQVALSSGSSTSLSCSAGPGQLKRTELAGEGRHSSAPLLS